MAAKPKWKRFEDLAAHIQASLALGAIVEQNVRIDGRRSRVKREIDISVKTQVGQYKLFVAIDCKDYKRVVNVKDVEAFIGLVKDVGANKGAIISASGFSEAAKNLAREVGIDLHRLIDAEAHDWQAYVSIPVLVVVCSLSSFSLSFSGTGPIAIEPQDFRMMMLFRFDGTPIDLVGNLIAERWNSDQLPRDAGEHEALPLVRGDTYVRTRGNLYRVDVRVNITVEETLFFGQLRLVEVKGLSDELHGGAAVSGFKTESINIDEVAQTWQSIRSREELAVQPVLTAGFFGHLPTISIEESDGP